MYQKKQNSIYFVFALSLHLLIFLFFVTSFFFKQNETSSLPGGEIKIIQATAISSLKSAYQSPQNSRPKMASIAKKEFHPAKKIEEIKEPSTQPQHHVNKTVSHENNPPVKKMVQSLVKDKFIAKDHGQFQVPPEQKKKLKIKKQENLEKEKTETSDKSIEPKTKQPTKTDLNQRKKVLEKALAQEMAKQAQNEMKREIKNEFKNIQKPKSLIDEKKLIQQAIENDEKTLLQSTAKTSETNNPGLDKTKLELVDKYKALMLNAIQQHWHIPALVSKDLSCELQITLAPGGAVLNAQIIRSSGVAILDQSVLQAVYQASPLPVPNDEKLFNTVRQVNLTARPEKII